MISLNQLYQQLTADPWRKVNPFSLEVGAATKAMLQTKTDKAAARILREWLSEHQPCLFGRFAAKRDQIAFCIIRPSHIRAGDDVVRTRIQAARRKFTAAAFKGKRSGFVIVMLSKRIAVAKPDAAMLAFAKRLTNLYLLEDIEADKIHLDEVFLQAPTRPKTAWRWVAGVNYFSAQGDKRWWHDHRIPGGMALSINSVGHMARSGQLVEALKQFAANFNVDFKNDKRPVESLGKALRLAMMTINRASQAVSGRATQLIPSDSMDEHYKTQCPFDIRADKELSAFDYSRYEGYYHTDFTLPAEYFGPSVERPHEQPKFSLDLTYLFKDALDNPDFIRMGLGQRIRERGQESGATILIRRRKAKEELIPINQSSLLTEALRLGKAKRIR